MSRRQPPATTEQVIQYFMENRGIHKQLQQFDDNNVNRHCIDYDDRSTYHRDTVYKLNFKMRSRGKNREGEMMEGDAKPKKQPLYADNNIVLFDSHRRYQRLKVRQSKGEVVECQMTINRKKYRVRIIDHFFNITRDKNGSLCRGTETG